MLADLRVPSSGYTLSDVSGQHHQFRSALAHEEQMDLSMRRRDENLSEIQDYQDRNFTHCSLKSVIFLNFTKNLTLQQESIVRHKNFSLNVYLINIFTP